MRGHEDSDGRGNFQMRRLVKSMLAGLAGEFYECTDGAEALVAYARHPPNVVLMDIRMGRADDITATQWIRAADLAARVTIVTDYDQPDLREAAHEAGAWLLGERQAAGARRAA